jgi:hypothetical protein
MTTTVPASSSLAKSTGGEAGPLQLREQPPASAAVVTIQSALRRAEPGRGAIDGIFAENGMKVCFRA